MQVDRSLAWIAALSALALGSCYRAHERGVDASAGPDANSPLSGCRPGLAGEAQCPPDRGDRGYFIIRGTADIGGRPVEVCVCAPTGCQPWVDVACHVRRSGDPAGLECAYTVPRQEGGGWCLFPCERDVDCPETGMGCFDVSEVVGIPMEMPRACFAVLE